MAAFYKSVGHFSGADVFDFIAAGSWNRFRLHTDFSYYVFYGEYSAALYRRLTYFWRLRDYIYRFANLAGLYIAKTDADYSRFYKYEYYATNDYRIQYDSYDIAYWKSVF